jgi:hypothetical protein
MSFLRESNWKYETWGSAGLSYLIFAGTIGELHLKDPTGHIIQFNYAGAGFGLGPKLPKWMKGLTGSAAPSSFESSVWANTLYISPNFTGDELTKDDLCGACAILEAGFSSPVYGKSVCAMFLGGSVGNPFKYSFSPETAAKAVIFLTCDNVGLAGGGSACLGSVTAQAPHSMGLWKVETNGNTYYYRFNDKKSTVKWAYDEAFTQIGGNGYRVMNNDYMRINWVESQDYEEWNLPLSSTDQSGYWYSRDMRTYPIKAEKVP